MDLFVNRVKLRFTGEVSLNIMNPLFNDVGGFTLPITIENPDAAIKAAFGFPAGKGTDSATEVDGMIRIESFDLSGVWMILDASEDHIKTSFITYQGLLYSKIKNLTLKDISYGGVKHPAGNPATIGGVLSYLEGFMYATYPESEFAVYCAYMPNAKNADTLSPLKVVNPVDHYSNGDPYLKFPTVGGNYALNSTMYLFVGTVLDYIFAEAGYRVEYSIFREDEDLRRLTIFNTMNCKGYHGFDYRLLVPNTTIADFFRALRDMSISILVNESGKSVSIRSFNQIIGQLPKVIDSYIELPTIDKSRPKGIKLPVNSPDDWMTQNYESETDFFPEYPITVNKLRDITPAAGTSDNLYLVLAESAYYQVVYKDSAYVLERRCQACFPYKKGTQAELQEVRFSFPGNYTYVEVTEWEEDDGHGGTVTVGTDVDYVMPRCDLGGNMRGHSYTDYPLMFCFARGKQEAHIVVGGNSPTLFYYPMGSFDVYDSHGAKISAANLALKWGGEYGLAVNFMNNFIDWIIERKHLLSVKSDAVTRVSDLFEFMKPVIYGKEKVLIDSFTLNCSVNREVVNDLKLWRL